MRTTRTCYAALALLTLAAAAPARAQAPAEPALRSHLFIYDLAHGTSHEVFAQDGTWEAPNWSPDGKYLIVNHAGAIYRLNLTDANAGKTAPPVKLAISPKLDCNNDKSLSPNGHQLAFSASSAGGQGSEVYVAQADGAGARQLTFQAPSYFHGWSPDGKTLAFVAQRHGSGQFDLYRIPSGGGHETQLTADPQHDDGPDYSPDGKWIYLNSSRSGKEAIWRFPAASTAVTDKQATMVLSDTEEDWFPHISPNGQSLLYITYPAGTPTHNSRELAVTLRLVPIQGDKVGQRPKTLLALQGGQGTLNVNSWSPDSEHFAYISYQRLP